MLRTFSKKILILVGALAFAGLANAIDNEVYHFTYNGFELPREASLPTEEIHPRIWFEADDVSSLVEKQNANEVSHAFWSKVVNSEYVLAELPPIPALSDDKKIVHKYYGTLTQVAAYNAFLYQVSSDRKGEYLAKAIEALKRGYAGPLYQLDPIVKGSAVDEIYQGIWAQSFAAAYDWVQPALSAEDDALIRAHLAEHAEYMYERLWSWASSPHNHLSKPAWGLGSVALCLSDYPNAGAWLQRAVEASNANTRYFFSRDGIYREGSHYYLFSALNFVPFLYHYTNTTDLNAFVAFQPAFEWPIRIRNGKGWMPNQEDSYIRPYPSQLVARAYREAVTSLHRTAPLAELLQWNFEKTDYSAFDKSEAKSGYNYTGATWDYPKSLYEFICYDPTIRASAPNALPVQFLDSGQTVFRNDWSFDDASHRYLLFQGVAEADNHEHYDHLSFILQAENQMMSSDSGYTRSSYGEAIRTDWFVTGEAHNVILVNGEATVDAAPNLAPQSSSRLVSPFFSCEVKQAPYDAGGTHQRLVAMVAGKRFAILDLVELPVAGDISIVMHGGRAILENRGDLQLWSYEEDDYGSASQLRQWFWGKGFKTQQAEGELTYIKGDYAPFPYIKHNQTATNALALHLLDPVGIEEAGSNFVYERKSSETLVVRSDDSLQWYAANATGALIDEGSWESDGLLSVFEFSGDGRFKAAGVRVKTLRIGKEIELLFNGEANVSLDSDADGSFMLYYSVAEPVQGILRSGDLSYRLELENTGALKLR